MFLVPTGIVAALVAREATGHGQHVPTSLLQGALLYTTQIWQHVEHADAAFHDLMAKTYPPGVHQPMIFECANREYLHLVGDERAHAAEERSTRSSARRPHPFRSRCRTGPRASEPTSRSASARRYKEHDRDDAGRRATGQQPCRRADHHDGGGALGSASAARGERHGRARRRSRARCHHADRRADPPARHPRRDHGAASTGRRSTTTRSGASSATPPRRLAVTCSSEPG